MNSVIYGCVGALATGLLFFLGAVCGWSAHKLFVPTPRAEEPGEGERRRLQEEQQAFEILRNYSAERAYGMVERGER